MSRHIDITATSEATARDTINDLGIPAERVLTIEDQGPEGHWPERRIWRVVLKGAGRPRRDGGLFPKKKGVQ